MCGRETFSHSSPLDLEDAEVVLGRGGDDARVCRAPLYGVDLVLGGVVQVRLAVRALRNVPNLFK